MAWVYLPSPPNLLDLAIEKRKINYKTKSFGYERSRKRKGFLTALLATCLNEHSSKKYY